jgi:hypothetical protein
MKDLKKVLAISGTTISLALFYLIVNSIAKDISDISSMAHEERVRAVYVTSLLGDPGAKCFLTVEGGVPPCLVRYTNNEVGLIVRVEDNLFIARYRIPMQPVTYEELAAMVSQKTLRLIHQTSADWPMASQDFWALVQGH